MPNMTCERVLVVDDSPLQCGALEVALKQTGVIQVEIAHHGLDALTLCDKYDFDLIICDLAMPEMDGLALISKLADRECRSKLCLLSGFNHEILTLASMMCQKLGLDLIASLSKPISEAQLKGILKTSVSEIIEPAQLPIPIVLNVEDLDSAFKTQQLYNVYQPQCRFRNTTTEGYEALIRWRHPRYGLVSPIHFLPIIEKENWHNRLFFYVLEKALNDFAEKNVEGTLSVNATHSNFSEPEFAGKVLEYCHQAGFYPGRLIIELTEMEAYQSDSVTFENFARLRLNNVELAIDDFGAGYSSLIKLADLPFTEMKIDRALIMSCHRDIRKRAILDVVVRMAKQLDMRVVAEGVEDSETWMYLDLLGIDLCQGYYTGRPHPIDSFVKD